jgi:hypothetical protein
MTAPCRLHDAGARVSVPPGPAYTLGRMVLARGAANIAHQLFGWHPRGRGGGFLAHLHSPRGYDEPEILRYSNRPFGPIGADAGQARNPRGLTFITRHSQSIGKAPRCSPTNLNLTAFGSRRTGWLFLGCPSPPSGYGPHDEVARSPGQARGPRQRPHPCRGARSPICSGSKSRPPDHPQPGSAKARWSALSAPLLYEIHPSCLLMAHLLCCTICDQRSGTKPRQVQVQLPDS